MESGQQQHQHQQLELYSQHWVTFRPDLIVDAKAGRMWKLSLRLQSPLLPDLGPDFSKMVRFLQERAGAKFVLLEVFHQRCLASMFDIQSLGAGFDLVNQQYRRHLDNEMQQNMALPPKAIHGTTTTKIILDQADFYSNIFSPLMTHPDMSLKRLISILIEYYRSLEQVSVPAQQFLSELLIKMLVRGGCWYQLHQLLQYRVISDSKVLACLLLSFEQVYPPSLQLAMDMMHRMRTSKEEIFQILVSKEKIIPGIKYSVENGLDPVCTRKLLEAALESKDNDDNDMVIFNTYSWVKENEKSHAFCELFEKRLDEIFGQEESTT